MRFRINNPFFCWIFVILLVFMTAGCSDKDLGTVPSPTFEKTLVAYLTTTPTPTLTPSPVLRNPKLKSTDLLAPTSTPLVYRVVANDTLTGIALQHAISLEELISANPGIDPNFLTIGMTLTIPVEGVISSLSPTSTPISIHLQLPECYHLPDESLQCLSVIENTQSYAVENVIVRISIQSIDGIDSVSQIAVTPLNLIPAGQKAVVSTLFPPTDLHEYQVSAQLLSVIPVSPDDQRYLQTAYQIEQIKISFDGLQARIMGNVQVIPEELETNQPQASSIWVSASAYDGNNKIVGIRKWIADDLMLSDEKVNFDFLVYSLGPVINRIEILTEARP
jgi:LysM repeat protein